MMGLDSNEHVLSVVRRHWLLFAFDVFFLAMLAVVPLVLLSLVPESVRAAFPLGWKGDELGLFLFCLWLLFLWVALFVRWTDYYLDIWVITDKRIMDVEQKGLFNREITTASLGKIQDVTIEVRGVLATFFGFGDVRIQTAGAEKDAIIIKTAQNPQRVKEMILRAADAVKPTHP